MAPRSRRPTSPNPNLYAASDKISVTSGGTGATAIVAIGHNSEIDDDALIAENFKLEDQIKAANAKLAEWAAPHKARIAEIEAEISRRLLERKANNTKTDSGTAYFSDLMNTKVEQTSSLFDFVADNWETIGGEIKIALPVEVVRQHMESNDGKPPPGMIVSFFRRLNIKRS